MADSETTEPKPKKEPIPWALRLTVLGVIFMIVFLVAIRWLNQASLFPPLMMDTSVGPERAKTRNDVREVSIPTGDGLALYGWVQGPDNAPRKIIQFGGNGEYVGPSADIYAASVQYLDAQFLLFDYRGFANSPGRKSEIGIYEDARSAYRFAVEELGWDEAEIILWGRSLGCAPAVRLAHELNADNKTPPRALLLEAPFLNIRRMASERMGFLVKPDWLVYNLMDNEARIAGLEVPVFIYHGTEDRIIPFEHGQELSKRVDAPSEFMELKGVGHNDIWDDTERGLKIRRRIDAFLEERA